MMNIYRSIQALDRNIIIIFYYLSATFFLACCIADSLLRPLDASLLCNFDSKRAIVDNWTA